MSGPPRFRQRFSQNFLIDAGVIDRIVRNVAPRADQRILEVGPGRGALTAGLMAAGHLQAVEIDRDLVAELGHRYPQLELHCGDILRVNLADLLADGPWRVVGNLPYNISTPLLFRMLEQSGSIADMTFMLQEEVVERICAPPGGGDRGRLSVMLQYRCAVTPLFRVPPECFVPRPRVHSRMVRLVPQPPAAVADSEPMFANVVRLAFAQRRKTLRNTLKPLLPDGRWPADGIDPGARPETLSVADFVDLSNAVGALQRQ